jgi:hypothetical protein
MTVYEQRTGEELPGLEGWSGDLIGGQEALHALWGDQGGSASTLPSPVGTLPPALTRTRPAVTLWLGVTVAWSR